MERISIQSDSPGYIKVSEIGKELIAFSEIIEKKYNQIDFELAFCFRALYTTRGINSKVRFYKDENWLGMDLIMPVDEFNPYKNNISMQRRIMGKYFFPFFSVNIHKYIYKLPILIVEKMGPHFAVGDTCYSFEEDIKTYNPDGKEIVARENEVSALRKTDIKKAYFGCHTDITMPYDELGEITAVRKDGSKITIIKDGRFVLERTELLNEPLEEI